LALKAKILGIIIIILILAGAGAAYQLRLFNRPPTADFDVSPKYIRPVDTAVTKLTGKGSDPDNDPLTYTWFIDGKQVNTTKDHWAILSAGNHTVQLAVSDGKATASKEKLVAVDKSTAHPTKKLAIPVKGVVYRLGDPLSSVFKSPDDEEMEEDLQIILDELGCNAIRIYGDYKGWPSRREYFSYVDGKVLKCTELAIAKGFETIIASPVYQDMNINQTVVETGNLAKKVQALSEKTGKRIVFMVGNSLTLFASGIYESATLEERVDEASIRLNDPVYLNKLNYWLKELLKTCRSYGKDLKLSYAASPGEVSSLEFSFDRIRWAELDIDIIAMHTYLDNDSQNWLPSKLRYLKKFGKSVFSSEMGALPNQVLVLQKTIEMLENLGVDGFFLYQYKSQKAADDPTSYGLLRYEGSSNPYSRDPRFFMYKSFVLSGSPPNPSSESAVPLHSRVFLRSDGNPLYQFL